MSQVGYRLPLSPQRVRRHKALESKRVFPREHVIHSPTQFVREDRERFSLAVLVFQFREIVFPRVTLTDEQHGGFGKGPPSMPVAHLVAGRAHFFATRFFGTCPQATRRDELVPPGKARDGVNLR